MWSNRLKIEITDPTKLVDFDLNLLVAELEGYKFDENGDAYEEVGLLKVPVYFTGNYEKMYRLLINNQIDINWTGVPGMERCKASAWADQENCSFPVTSKQADAERAILEVYVQMHIKREEVKNASIQTDQG